MDDTRLSLSASLNDTLTYNESGKNKKSRMSVTNIFNIASSNREREKVDQLQEILSRYSNSELPRLPPLLALSRPQCVKECFQVETHWSALVTNASSLSKRQHNQQEAIWELLQTELSYIRHLRVIIDVFQTCLVNIQQEGLLCEIDLEKLLGNIDQIMELNSALWQEKLCQVLEDARSSQHLLNPSVMKSAFTKKFREFVKPYTHYCLHQKQCVSYMKSQFKGNELFRNFVRWAEAQKQCNRLKLADIQVKPMQRLTKYSLLLQAILRKTDNDFQRRDLLEMIASVDKYVGSINAQLQQHHELEKLEAILNKIEPYDAVECPNDSECVKIVHEYNSNFNLMAPMSGFHTVHHRRLLMHSNLRMKEAQIRADVDCFLFSDLILICKTNRRMEKFKIFRPPMRLDHIMVADLKDKGSFLLIYLNEYHVPSSVYTFHGDPCAVKVCLEKITSAQRDYRQQKLDDQQMHGMSTVSSSGDAEEVEYSPLPAQSLMPILSLSPSLLRLNSVDTSEDHFLPTVASDGVTMSSCCDRSDNLCFSESAVSSLQPNVDLSDFDTVHSEQHSTDLSHRKHPQCNVVMSHSVPNMTDMEAFMLHNVPDTDSHSVPNIAGTHAAETKDCIPPVHQHTEAVGVCDTESYPCTARCDDSDVESNRVYARRLSRCDKRHYTADSIPELLNVQRDSSIHKRLSWQDETRVTESSCTQVLSSESIHSSSGVSSVGSLYLHQESDISMDSETPRHHCRITLSERQCATVGTSSSQSCDDSDGASVKHLAVVFQSLQTGGREDGISSVSLEKDGNLETRRLSSDQLTLLKNKLLLDTDVEAS